MALDVEKEALLDLAEEYDGLLTVDVVLEAAADEDSPLHRHFTWDDSVAATQYRRWQARALIAKCRIVIESRPDTEVRAFVSLPSDRQAEGGGYRLTVDVQHDDDQRAELMRDITSRVLYWQRQSALLDLTTRKALDRFAASVATATQQPAAA